MLKSSLINYKNGFLHVHEAKAIYYPVSSSKGTKAPIELSLPPIKRAIPCNHTPLLLTLEHQLLFYTGEAWEVAKTPPTDTLKAGCFFNRQYFILTAHSILTTTNFKEWHTLSLPTQNKFIGISSTDSLLIALCHTGEMWHSLDGVHWELFDYNAYYNEAIHFTGIHTMKDGFYAFGKDKKTDLPVLIYSLFGTVWHTRPIQIFDSACRPMPDSYGLTPYDAIWDGKQHVLFCSHGVLLIVPDCPHCNCIHYIGTQDFVQAALYEDTMAYIDCTGKLTLTESMTLNQPSLSRETVKLKMQQNTPLIDVRSEVEYSKKHIEGSVNIPVSYISEQLPKSFPNQKTPLIFCCSTGTRAKQALDKALLMGYSEVYVLNLFDKWEL